MKVDWTLAQLTGYLRTWSATVRFVEAHGHDPVVALERDLAVHWDTPDGRRRVSWPLSLRVGRRGSSWE